MKNRIVSSLKITILVVREARKELREMLYNYLAFPINIVRVVVIVGAELRVNLIILTVLLTKLGYASFKNSIKLPIIFYTLTFLRTLKNGHIIKIVPIKNCEI